MNHRLSHQSDAPAKALRWRVRLVQRFLTAKAQIPSKAAAEACQAATETGNAAEAGDSATKSAHAAQPAAGDAAAKARQSPTQSRESAAQSGQPAAKPCKPPAETAARTEPAAEPGIGAADIAEGGDLTRYEQQSIGTDNTPRGAASADPAASQPVAAAQATDPTAESTAKAAAQTPSETASDVATNLRATTHAIEQQPAKAKTQKVNRGNQSRELVHGSTSEKLDSDMLTDRLVHPERPGTSSSDSGQDPLLFQL